MLHLEAFKDNRMGNTVKCKYNTFFFKLFSMSFINAVLTCEPIT